MSAEIFDKPTVADKINKLYEKTVAFRDYDFDFYTLGIKDYAGIHTYVLQEYFYAQKKANLALLGLMRVELTTKVGKPEQCVLSAQALADLFLQLVRLVRVIQELCGNNLVFEEENEEIFCETLALSRVDNKALFAAENVPTLVHSIGRVFERVEQTQDCKRCQNYYKKTLKNPLKVSKDLPADIRRYLNEIKK